MVTYIVLFILSLLTSIGATSDSNSPHLREVYRFPNGTWVENIAVRPNGNLLVTLLNTPELWEVIPSIQPGNNSRARLIHHFHDAETVTGIAELTSDVYAVLASNSVWKVNLNRDEEEAIQTRIITIPAAGNLNGMAALKKNGAGTVAISDSTLGLVWRVDTNTGNYTVTLKDKTMAASATLGPLLGINGLRVLHDHVYYVNTPKQLYCRVCVDTLSGQSLGPYEIISQGVLADDFAISPRGVGYLAGLTHNIITRVFVNGTREAVAGSSNSTAVMTATSAAFGRTSQDSNVLYITTGGETSHPVNNTYSRGGKIMALTVDF